MISIVRRPGQGICFGGTAITADVAVSDRFPAATVEIWDDETLLVAMSRDEASDFANAIVGCLCDG